MKKISKEVIDVKNVNVNACLHPHPLISESYEDIEEEWFSWIPGFDKTELGDEDEDPLFRDNNIQLYDKIESIAVDRFNIALENVWPLLDSYLINSLHISIDITGMLCSSSTLAAYNYVDSNPQKGNYIFNLAQSYLYQLLVASDNGKELKLKYHTTWEHEIIHLIDHWQSVKSSAYRDSDVSSVYYNYYLSQYRTEGIAELYYLLKGGIEDIKNMSQAKEKFQSNLERIQKLVIEKPKITDKEKDTEFKTYDFYELGPWIILDMLRTFQGGYHEELINSVIVKVEAGEVVEHDVIIDVIRIALSLKTDEFLNAHLIN
jgi:hypothetical protein